MYPWKRREYDYPNMGTIPIPMATNDRLCWSLMFVQWHMIWLTVWKTVVMQTSRYEYVHGPLSRTRTQQQPIKSYPQPHESTTTIWAIMCLWAWTCVCVRVESASIYKQEVISTLHAVMRWNLFRFDMFIWCEAKHSSRIACHCSRHHISIE